MSTYEIFENKENFLFKYRAVNEQNIKMLSEDSIWASKPSELNDPFEVSGLGIMNPDRNVIKINDPVSRLPPKHKLSIKEKVKLFSGYGIYSLSKACSTLLLWSHYANSSKGFCIIYDKVHLIQNLNPICHFDVYYRPPSYDLTDSIHFPFTPTMIYGNKPLEWEYEKEYRFIFNQSGMHTYESNSLIGIIFGCNCTGADMQLIINALCNHSVKFYKQVNTTFAFDHSIISLNEYNDWFRHL